MELERVHTTSRTNEQLLEELMNAYGSNLKKVIFLYIKDKNMTEDILQETFISCYKNLNQFRDESSYKTWLVRIAINKCKDYLRKKSLKDLILSPVDNNKIKNENTPERILVNKYRNEELLTVILKLPIKFREVIILFYYENFSIEEICSLTGLKSNTVKSRLLRARKKLFRFLGGGYVE